MRTSKTSQARPGTNETLTLEGKQSVAANVGFTMSPKEPPDVRIEFWGSDGRIWLKRNEGCTSNPTSCR